MFLFSRSYDWDTYISNFQTRTVCMFFRFLVKAHFDETVEMLLLKGIFVLKLNIFVEKCWFYHVQNGFLDVLLPKPMISIWLLRQHSTLCETIEPKYDPRIIHVLEVISPFFLRPCFTLIHIKLETFFFVQKSCLFLWSGIIVDSFLDCFPKGLTKRGCIYYFLDFYPWLPLPLYKGATFIQGAKRQLISKANCQAMNFSKKWTNEFVFTTLRRTFVRF